MMFGYGYNSIGSISVWTFQGMHADKCGGIPGVCDEMDPYDGELLRNYLRNSSFAGK